MLHRKYYREFAKIIGESKDKKEIIEKFEDFFAGDNPNFDRYVFRKAVSEAQAKRMAEVL